MFCDYNFFYCSFSRCGFCLKLIWPLTQQPVFLVFLLLSTTSQDSNWMEPSPQAKVIWDIEDEKMSWSNWMWSPSCLVQNGLVLRIQAVQISVVLIFLSFVISSVYSILLPNPFTLMMMDEIKHYYYTLTSLCWNSCFLGKKSQLVTRYNYTDILSPLTTISLSSTQSDSPFAYVALGCLAVVVTVIRVSVEQLAKSPPSHSDDL